MSGLAGDTVTVNLLESLQQECDGRILGPFVVTDQAVWSSSNTAVITVGPVTTAGCQVSCLAAGTANAHADFDGVSSILDITSGVCEGTFIPFPADCPFDVKHSCTIRDSSSMVGEIFTDCSEHAYSGPKRPLIPKETGHPFRSKAATHSGVKPATF